MKCKRFAGTLRVTLAVALFASAPAALAAGSNVKSKAATTPSQTGANAARIAGPVQSPRRDGTVLNPMRRMTAQQRLAAANRAAGRRKVAEKAGILRAKAKSQFAKPKNAKPADKLPAPTARADGITGVRGAAAALLEMAVAQVGTPDLYAMPNYATSKLPIAHCSVATTVLCQKDSDCPGYLDPYFIEADQYPGGETCTGPVVPGTGIQKFVDTLALPCAQGVNTLGNCMSVAVPDKTTFPGADYYELGVTDFNATFHRDLPQGAKVRGYYQKNAPSGAPALSPHYLGPLIIADVNRPVRLKMVNEVAPNAEYFLPVDKTLGGTNLGPDGTPFPQNRVTIHLHGGNTPWISDGTLHQWTAPKGETASHFKKGAAVAYVPDMWFDASGNVIQACAGQTTCAAPGASNNPGDGALSFYYTNQQSTRFMFYHDHASGITRIGVYAGQAAGYLLVDKSEEDRLAAGTVPGTMGTTPDSAHMIPLVLQDKSFVPPAAQLAQQDPTWDIAKWGGEGSLWFPHVYIPNQWTDAPDESNANPMGRWDYGPWFWPVQTSLTEVTWDGQTVNRPLLQPCTSTASVTPTNPTGATTCPTTPAVANVPESFLDTPLVNGVAYPTVTIDPVAYRFHILNAANDRNLNLSFFEADASGTEVTMVPAAVHLPTSTQPLCAASAPLSAVTGTPNGPDLQTPTCWPREWPADARQGGVPDPAAVGPKWIRISSEGGVLPAPAIIPPQPVNYEKNKRNITVLNVTSKSLFLGPAERADMIVDFSAYAGKTLILYNDSPAPVPAGDPRLDLYTGGPDMTTTGGAPTPLPGYGPNIRTFMQVKVRASPTQGSQPPLDLAQVTTAVQDNFRTKQPPPVVPEAAYNALYNPAVPYTNTYLPIEAMSLTFTPVLQTTPITIPFGNKALHELFTTDYGRMNSLLAMEIPNTSWLNQTTIPYANYDPATEFLTDGQPQIWKVTHNGVDTHTIHFHLFNAQVINRVGWDGQIVPPDDNELGWKDVVRMHPLQDVVLALLPVKQNLPWPLPDMIRPLDVDRKLGTASQFTGVDIYNNPIQITNQLVNFGQEYIWHCHLLGHEDSDMLRSEILVTAPEVPVSLTAAAFTSPTRRNVLTFTDASKSAMSFLIQRSTSPSFTNPTPFSIVAPAAHGQVTYTDRNSGLLANTLYYYRVQAQKVLTSPALPGENFPATSAWSNVATAGPAPIANLTPKPLGLGFANIVVGTTSPLQTVTLTNTGASTLTISGITLGGTDANQFTMTTTCGASLAVNAACAIRVTFKPTTTGAKTASVTVATNDPISPSQVVPLTGTGIIPGAGDGGDLDPKSAQSADAGDGRAVHGSRPGLLQL